MKPIHEVVIEDELVSLKKGKFGYRVVHPPKDYDGKIIWINLLIGGWENFFKLIFILFVIGCFLYGFQQATDSCKDMTENPCKYFDIDCTRYYNQGNYNPDIQIQAGDYDDKT